MNYVELYQREREIRQFRRSRKTTGQSGCLQGMIVPGRLRKDRKGAVGFGKVLRSFFQVFH